MSNGNTQEAINEAEVDTPKQQSNGWFTGSVTPRTIHEVVHEQPSPAAPAETAPQPPALFARWWFRVWLLVNVVGLILLAMLLPTTYDAEHNHSDSLLNTLVRFGLIALIVANMAELVLRAVVIGIGPFLKDPLSLLDLLALGGCGAALTQPTIFPGGVALCRVFRLAQVATVVWDMQGPLVVARSLLYSPRVMGKLFLYMLFWAMLFALMGLEFYMGSLKRRCTKDSQMVLPETWCGDTGNEEFFGSTRCLSQFGHECDSGYGNPYNGLASFDSIGQASLIVCSITTTSDWTLYLQALEQAEFSVSFLFPMAIIVIMALIAINLFVAAVAFGFSRVMAENASEKEAENGNEKDSDSPLNVASAAVAPSGLNECGSAADESSSQDNDCLFRFRALLRSDRSETFVIIVVVLNSILMASYRADMSEVHESVMWYGEIGFTSFFCLEFGVKLTAFGPQDYFSDNWNVFDSVVVFFSVLDLLIIGYNVSQMRLLRLFRAFRASRFLRSLKPVRQILAAISASIHMVCWVCCGLMCVTYVFALVSHQLFAYKFDKFDPVPRATFDTILSSCLCLCQCITGSGWESIMFNAMDDPNTGWAAAPCFIGAYIITNFLIINLLIAAILDAINTRSIETSDDEDQDEETVQITECGLSVSENPPNEADSKQHITDPEADLEVIDLEEEADRKVSTNCTDSVVYKTDVEHVLPHQKDAANDNGKPPTSRRNSLHGRRNSLEEEVISSCCQSECSLWMFHKDSSFRMRIQSISASRAYKIVLLVNVLLSTGILIFDSKRNRSFLYEHSAFRDLEDASTHYFTAVFTIDFLVLAIAHGGVFKSGPSTPYLRHSVFNKLDFAALVFMYVDLATHAVWDSSLLLRLGRCSRPLRLFGRAPLGVKRVVVSFVNTLPLLFHVIMICNAAWFCFAVAGTMQFAGRLSWCNDDSRAGKSDCLGTFIDSSGYVTPRRWANWWRSFDNVGLAYVTLYECVSTDSWTEVMYACMDAVGDDKQPERNHDVWPSLFFVGFMCFGSFFIVQLFVTVIIDCYGELQDAEDGLLQESQHEYNNIEKILAYNKPLALPQRPSADAYWGISTFLYDLCVPWDLPGQDNEIPNDLKIYKFEHVNSCMWAIRHHLQAVITFLILLNAVIMSTKHAAMSEEWEDLLNLSNIVFASIFGFELIIKLLAWTPKYYWSDYWNIFDSIVVTACVAVIPLQGTFYAHGPNVLRAVRLLKEIDTFRMFTTQLILSVSRIFNVVLVLVIVLFVFAVAGVEFFGSVRYGAFLNGSRNFDTVSNSLMMLFRVTFNEWVYARHDCRVEVPECTYAEDCGSVMATPYFALLHLLNAYVLANMFVAVVLTDFTWLYASEMGITLGSVSGMLCENQMNQVRAGWWHLDPRGKGFILETDLGRFVKSVDAPLGFKSTTLTPLQLESIRAEAAAFPLAQTGRVRYRDILTVLALQQLGRDAIPCGHELEEVRPPNKFKSAIKAVIKQLRVANLGGKTDLSNWATVRSLLNESQGRSLVDREEPTVRAAAVLGIERSLSAVEKVQMLLQESSGKSQAALEELSPLQRMKMLAELSTSSSKDPFPVSLPGQEIEHVEDDANVTRCCRSGVHVPQMQAGVGDALKAPSLSSLEQMQMLVQEAEDNQLSALERMQMLADMAKNN